MSIWPAVTAGERIALLQRTRTCTHKAAAEWVRLSAQAKGLAPGSYLAGEEWISGPWAVLFALNRYIRTLRKLARGTPPLDPRSVRITSGANAVNVFPTDLYDRILLPGVCAKVRLHDAKLSFLNTTNEAHTVLILGAGNISSIPALDVLYKLLAENAMCVVKLNPVNEYLRPTLESALAPFVENGFVRFVSGGADLGAQLCADDAIDEIHVTGSIATYHAIKAIAGGKRVTAELGSVTPTIVVPGEWSDRDLRFQAENVATQKAHNAGFNCIAAQVLILPQEWSLKDRFLREINSVFQSMEQRPEYYPGSSQRRAALGGRDSPLPAVVRLDPQDMSQAFEAEAFCGLLFCIELPGDAKAFLRDAVALANERLYGTLGANVIVAPQTERAMPEAIEGAVSDLRYGCIAINAWAGVGYFLTETPWGAYRGSGDGTGVVHNSYFLAHTEKSVVRAPFRPLTKPPWFVTNTKQATIGRLLCDFEAARTPANALKVIAAAI